MQEAETLSGLCHPCVIAMYGIIVGQESPATVLEFVRGASLKSAMQNLSKQGKVTARLKCAIALQAARGAPPPPPSPPKGSSCQVLCINCQPAAGSRLIALCQHAG